MPVIGPQIDKTPAGFHADDPPEVHYLEPKEGGDGGVQLVAHGEPAQMLLNNNMNLNVLRPYLAYNKRNNKYVPLYNSLSVNENGEAVSVPTLATNATLRQYEWRQIDQTVLNSARKRLRFYQGLVSAGLTYPLNDAMGVSVLGWDKLQDDDGDARITMAPDVPPAEGRATFDREYIPIPLVCKGFRMNIRELNESRKLGQPLNTLNVEQAVRKVAEAIEKMAIVGTGGITYGGGSIYGMLNFPHRTTGDLTSAWTNSAADPVTDIRNMKQSSIDDYHYGPWNVYVPSNFETVLDKDYVANYPRTIRERIMAIEGINSIQVTDYMTSSNVALLELDTMSARVIVGFEPRTVQWSAMGGMALYFMIMACIVPNFRADANNRSGVVHYS